MKKNVVKFLSALVLSIMVASPVFAEDAIVTFVKGKVEVQRGDAWVPLKVGDKIKQSETVSTGIQSEAKIKYSGSLMAVGAMTRITMDQLSAGDNKEKVDVYLSTGAVRSKVTHDADTRVSYTVRSPVAVASVRGTEFQITDKGDVACFEGAVAVYPNIAKKDADTDTESVEEEAEEEAVEGDNGPADSTTPANEINDDAPDSAVVVGANQKTKFTKSGTPEKPQDNAKKNANKVKNAVQTAAAKEAVSTGGSSSDAGTQTTPTGPKTGSVEITIVIE